MTATINIYSAHFEKGNFFSLLRQDLALLLRLAECSGAKMAPWQP